MRQQSDLNNALLAKPVLLLVVAFAVLLSLAGCSEGQRTNPDNKVEDKANKESLATTTNLLQSFQSPPQTAKPGVYWYFMDGNQNREEMTKDLEAMAAVGLSKVIFLEVNIGIPRGPVDFMSEQWQDNFAHAVRTAERLNMEVILGTGPGWAGSGGPWVKPEESMQHLVGATTLVTGPQLFEQTLAVPPLPTANNFAGMDERLQAVRENWYQDVAVLAYPTPESPATIAAKDLKTLKETKPYSLWKTTPRYIDSNANYREPDINQTINSNNIIELTSKMQADGTLKWQVPKGNWTIMRFVARTTGQTTRPAPKPGHGFDTDKFNPQAFLNHWDNFQGKLLKKVEPGINGRGWTRIHLDSWEMSSQNWSQNFEAEFKQRRGYDPRPFFPAYAGLVVDSLEKTERFLWDLRQTAKELVINNYAKVIRDKAHSLGMLYSNQPYDMNPAGDIDLGAVADIPSCEFWDYRNGSFIDSLYSCIEATSIAHTTGKNIIPVEAFTSAVPLRFNAYPGQMKNQTDWALAFGVTNFIYHTFQHQPLGDDYLPGMSMGPHGTNWHRHQNWWDMLPAYHGYVSRASHLLQQGVSVADILYLTPEGVPHIFWPPNDALIGEGLIKDKRGYSFDAVSADILKQRSFVNEQGRIQFEKASDYKVLVLPDMNTMTVATLEKIVSLVEAGATVIGNPPKQSPSLVNYPQADKTIQRLVTKLWGGNSLPNVVLPRQFGKGQVIWGAQLYDKQDNSNVEEVLYPSYENTTAILAALGLKPDFAEVYVNNVDALITKVPIQYNLATTQKLRFIHRKHIADDDIQDVYFIANRSDDTVETFGQFRVSDVVPYLWDPETGKTRELPSYRETNGITQIPLRLVAHESFFIVFKPQTTAIEKPTLSIAKNFPAKVPLMNLNKPWSVAFDAARSGPSSTIFSKLIDWRDHHNPDIKYYSGKALYTTSFDLPANADVNTSFTLDVGEVYEMARVTINGVEQGIIWTAPYQLTISSPLKTTGNVLTIEIANSWENRLIGDALPENKARRSVSWSSGLLEGKTFNAGPHTFTTYLDKAEDFGEVKHGPKLLQPSGLIGPVKLLTH